MCQCSTADVLQTIRLAAELPWLLLSQHQQPLSLLSHLRLDQAENQGVDEGALGDCFCRDFPLGWVRLDPGERRIEEKNYNANP